MGGRSIGEGGAGSSDDLDELVEELFGGAGQQGLVVLCPKVPKQNNDCDCGVFALQYAEEVVVRSPDIYPVDLRRNTVAGFNARMFCVKQMHVKRANLKVLIPALVALHTKPSESTTVSQKSAPSGVGKRKRK